MKLNELSKFVGNRIREFRKKKKLTQKELGDMIGVKHNTISGYENGSSSPEQDTLFKLARALDVSVDAFFPETDGSLESTLKNANNLDFDDMLFLKQLIRQAETLPGRKREKLMDSIRLAVEYFNKMNQ